MINRQLISESTQLMQNSQAQFEKLEEAKMWAGLDPVIPLHKAKDIIRAHFNDSALVEKVARVICEHDTEGKEMAHYGDDYRIQAKAAIKAMVGGE